MKASEIIKRLEELQNQVGDCDIEVRSLNTSINSKINCISYWPLEKTGYIIIEHDDIKKV